MDCHNNVSTQTLFDISLQNHIVRKPIPYVIHAELRTYFSAKLRVC